MSPFHQTDAGGLSSITDLLDGYVDSRAYLIITTTGAACVIIGTSTRINHPAIGLPLVLLGIALLILSSTAVAIACHRDADRAELNSVRITQFIAPIIIHFLTRIIHRCCVTYIQTCQKQSPPKYIGYNFNHLAPIILSPRTTIILLILTGIILLLSTRVTDSLFNNSDDDDNPWLAAVDNDPSTPQQSSNAANTENDVPSMQDIEASFSQHSQQRQKSNINKPRQHQSNQSAQPAEPPTHIEPETQSYNQIGLKAHPHARFKLFNKYHSQCLICHKSAKDKVRLVIDFKNQALAKKYAQLNEEHPERIPLDALTVVCLDHTIDRQLGRLEGTGCKGRVTLHDIKHFSKYFGIPSYNVNALHPGWREKLMKQCHHSCQVCGKNKDTRGFNESQLTIDFKNLQAAMAYMKLNTSHPEKIPINALTVVCKDHGTNYYASQNELFHHHLKVFKQQQRRLENWRSVRKYVTEYGNHGLGYKCTMCGRGPKDIGADGKELGSLHLDHVFPISKGGLTRVDNLQWLCRDCNLSKGNLTK